MDKDAATTPTFLSKPLVKHRPSCGSGHGGPGDDGADRRGISTLSISQWQRRSRIRIAATKNGTIVRVRHVLAVSIGRNVVLSVPGRIHKRVVRPVGLENKRVIINVVVSIIAVCGCVVLAKLADEVVTTTKIYPQRFAWSRIDRPSCYCYCGDKRCRGWGRVARIIRTVQREIKDGRGVQTPSMRRNERITVEDFVPF
jgi:hypothetical protein